MSNQGEVEDRNREAVCRFIEQDSKDWPEWGHDSKTILSIFRFLEWLQETETSIGRDDRSWGEIAEELFETHHELWKELAKL